MAYSVNIFNKLSRVETRISNNKEIYSQYWWLVWWTWWTLWLVWGTWWLVYGLRNLVMGLGNLVIDLGNLVNGPGNLVSWSGEPSDWSREPCNWSEEPCNWSREPGEWSGEPGELIWGTFRLVWGKIMCDGDTFGHYIPIWLNFFYMLGYVRNENISKHSFLRPLVLELWGQWSFGLRGFCQFSSYYQNLDSFGKLRHVKIFSFKKLLKNCLIY